MIAVGRALARAVATALLLPLVLTSGACGEPTHQLAPAPVPVTLNPGPPDAGTCAPDRLVRCAPGLADFDEPIFGDVLVDGKTRGFASLPAAFTTPEEGVCKELPRLGADDDPELDVVYFPTERSRKPEGGNLFHAKSQSDLVSVRLMAASGREDVGAGMADWVRRCPTWAITRTLNDGRTQGWLVAQSADTLARYQDGDVAGQWRNVNQVAGAVLDNGVIVQAWYSTDDPSAESRKRVLSQIVAAVGKPRPRSALPPRLADWTDVQLSGLLPPLSQHALINTGASERGEFTSLCQPSGGNPVATHQIKASWRELDPQRPPTPDVTISAARPGEDYLAELRRAVETCAPHATEMPEPCRQRPNRQFLQSDSAVAEGEDTVRITRRWMRVESVQAYDRCVERIESLRVTQLRGLLIVSRYVFGGPKTELGEAPQLPSSTADGLQADTVRRVKAA